MINNYSHRRLVAVLLPYANLFSSISVLVGWLCAACSLGPIDKPVDIAADYELAPYQIGELLVSGWHVNTYQVSGQR